MTEGLQLGLRRILHVRPPRQPTISIATGISKGTLLGVLPTTMAALNINKDLTTDAMVSIKLVKRTANLQHATGNAPAWITAITKQWTMTVES